MKFSKSLLDEIRDKIVISDVVGKRVALKKRGKEYIGLSPFQNEKTPSFTVNNEKQFYHCFSTNKHGDIFTFLVEVEGLTFPQAVEKLADQAGVEVRTLTKEEEKRVSLRKKLYSVTEKANDYFIENLKSDNRALKYLKDRGINSDIISFYNIGYSKNDFSSLLSYLIEKGFSNEEIFLAGLVIENEKNKGKYYDRYRDRIIFPIRDSYGRIAGFGGRVLNNENIPKYMNSPETDIFHKGSLLYNYSNLKVSSASENLIVVEGYMDAISLCSKGITNVVAPLGTAITEKQLNLIWSISDAPIICFDGDDAGKKAAKRLIQLGISNLGVGKTIRFINLNENVDPDDFIRDKGVEEFDDLIKNATPLNKQIWNNLFEDSDLSSPEGRANLEKELRDILRKIKDKDIRKHYGLFFKESLDKTFNYNNSSKVFRKNYYRSDDLDKLKIMKSKVASGERIPSGLESLLVSGVLIYPEIIDMHYESIENLIIHHKKLNKIRDDLITHVSLEKNINIKKTKEFINYNYSNILENDLKFSKKYWSNYKNSNIQSISTIWFEIYNDDHHIKSLDNEIVNFDKNILDDKDESRLLGILEQKDIQLKKITEKYGQ